MQIGERINSIIERFDSFNQWEDRYRDIIKLGKSLEGLEQNDKQEKYRIKGCQSQVWLKASLDNGKVLFKADSDAVLVKGIVALLIEAYSGSTPDEIITHQADFLNKIGISEHLSMNRTNGLASMVKQIQIYAMAFKALTDKGVMNANP